MPGNTPAAKGEIRHFLKRKPWERREIMRFWVKAQDVDQNTHVEHMVNVCDAALLGKELGATKIYEHFYKGELVDAAKMLSEIQDGNLINLFGDDCVELAIESGFVDEEDVKEIHGVKHAIIIKI